MTIPTPGTAPTEAKVKAARLAAGVAALLTGLAIRYLPFLEPLQESDDFLTGLVADGLVGLFAAGAAWWAGWRARHTFRPDLGEPTPQTGPEAVL